MALRFCDNHGKDGYVAFDNLRYPNGCPHCNPLIETALDPRAPEAGGGWNATVKVNGEVVAGGAFPVTAEQPDETEAWNAAFEWMTELAASYGAKEITA